MKRHRRKTAEITRVYEVFVNSGLVLHTADPAKYLAKVEELQKQGIKFTEHTRRL